MMDDDNEFQNTDAGALGMEKISAGSLHKGNLVMIKGHPCKVVSFSTAKTGKHGSAKAMITGIDIFSSNKYECTFSTGDTVDAPVCTRLEYNLINIEDDGFVTLLDDNGNTKEDLKLPEDEWLKDVADKAKEIFEDGTKECIVTVLSALGMEKIIAAREGKEQ
jgi:translation initiation factor 5A